MEIFCQDIMLNFILETSAYSDYFSYIKKGLTMENEFLQIIRQRRSVYNLNDKINDKQQQILNLINESVKYAPSSFNSQSARVVVLFDEQHHKLWQITHDCLQKIVPEPKFASTKAKLKAFDAAYGTILFFEDETVVSDLQNKFMLYKDNFPVWSEQANGMLQFAIWCGLAEMKVGANLQHYNPLIDDEVRSTWKLPPSWKLIAQMPFGGITQPAGEKTFVPLEQRIKVFW